MIRVLLADDQALVRDGLRLILDLEDDIEVVAEAADGGAAVKEVLRLRPDVALMDVRMPGVDGIEATRRIVAAGSPTRVLILTTFDLDEFLYRAVRAGASGFLLKDSPRHHLLHAVRTVAAGEELLDPAITARLLREWSRRPPPSAGIPEALSGLTARERDVFLLLARGLSNREIAERLVLSETTVKTHVSHALEKLGLRDRVHAAIYGYESGLIRPGEG